MQDTKRKNKVGLNSSSTVIGNQGMGMLWMSFLYVGYQEMHAIFWTDSYELLHTSTTLHSWIKGVLTNIGCDLFSLTQSLMKTKVFCNTFPLSSSLTILFLISNLMLISTLNLDDLQCFLMSLIKEHYSVAQKPVHNTNFWSHTVFSSFIDSYSVLCL